MVWFEEYIAIIITEFGAFHVDFIHKINANFAHFVVAHTFGEIY